MRRDAQHLGQHRRGMLKVSTTSLRESACFRLSTVPRRCAIADVVADFDAYKEGSEEAFRMVVDAKQNREERVRQLESTIQSQQALIANLRAKGQT